MRRNELSRRFLRAIAGVALLAISMCTHGALGQSATGPASQPSASPPTERLTGDWLGLRSSLLQHGIEFDPDILIDGSKNLRGGRDTAGSAWRHLFELTIKADTEPLLGVKDGTVFADFQNQSGQNGSSALTGDFQRFDNIDADGRTQLEQVWYQQIVFGGALRIKAGKIDANSEFDKPDNGSEFLQSSSAFSPTIFVLPTYPDAALSVNVYVKTASGYYAGVGLYDGAVARGVPTGSLGLTHPIRGDDLFEIAEIGKRWGTNPGQLAGRFAIGGWYDTNRFARLDGKGSRSGTGGPYALFDQTLWRPSDADPSTNRGVAVFGMCGQANGALSIVDSHLGGGIVWNGPIAVRAKDVAGLGINTAHFSSDAAGRHGRETSVEVFYRAHLTPAVSAKPDVQYIASPGGQLRDALVFTLRVQIDF